MVIARFGMSEVCTRFVRGKFFLNDSGLTISPYDADEFDSRFLEYLIVSLNDAIYTLGRGTAQKNLDVEAFRNLPIYYPVSLTEQERIVAILDEAFEAIATATVHAERNLENARDVFQSVLQSTFEQKGEGWVETALGDAVTEACTLSYGIVQPGHEEPKGLPVVRPTDMRSSVIHLDGLKRIDPARAAKYSRTALKGGEILLCVRGSTGIISKAAHELAGANVTRGIVPICFNSKVVDQAFGYYLLLSPPTQIQVKEKTYGAALMQINIRDVRKLAIRVPPLRQQKAIVQKLDALAAETRSLENIYQCKLGVLAELKQSLLQKAFSGELTADEKAVERKIVEAGV